MAAPPIAALDVGGTAVKSGLVLPDDRVERTARTPVDAHADAERLIDTLSESVRPLLAPHSGQHVEHLRIAFPAPFDYAAGRPRLTHKFAALHGVDLAALLRSSLGRDDLDVAFVNDAEAAAVGEARCGAAVGGDRVLTITLGTGLGAALTVGTSPLSTVRGQFVGDLYRRPTRGTTGGTDGAIADDVFCAGGLAIRLGVPTNQLAEAVDDPAKADALTSYGADLGRFLAGAAAEFEADLVVLGGAAVPGADAFRDAFTNALGVPWARAHLGLEGPLIGAARMVPPTSH